MTYQPIVKTLTALALVGFLAACESSEERAEKHYQSGLSLIEQGDTERALVELRNVFDLNGNHLEARKLYAKTMRDLGRYGEAYGQYLRLTEQAPDDVEARIALAEMAVLTRPRDYPEQIRVHSERAILLDPDNPRAQAVAVASDYIQAEIGSNRADRAAAFEKARALLETQPDNPTLLRIALAGYVGDGDFAAALDIVDRLLAQSPDDKLLQRSRLSILAQLQDKDGMEAQLKDMVRRFDDDLEIKKQLFGFYAVQGAPEKAEAFLREIADPAAEDKGLYISLVRYIAEQKGIDAAIAELDSVIGTIEDDSVLKALRAGYMFDKGQRDEAIAALQALVSDAEPSEQQRAQKVALARMLLTTKNEVGARQLVEQVLAEDPTQAGALKMTVEWQMQAGDYDNAIANLRTVLDKNPKDLAAMDLMSRAYLGAAQVLGADELDRKSDLQAQASDFLALAMDESGKAPAQTIRYARFLMADGQLIPAEQALVSALRTHENNTALLTQLGQVYIALDDMARLRQVVAQLKEIGTEEASRAAVGLETTLIERTRGTEEAIAFLEDVTKDWDDNSGAKVAIIRSHLKRGERDAALATAQEMLDEKPDDPSRRYLLAATQAAAGKLEEAKANYKALLEQSPKAPAIWLQLIRIATIQKDAASVAELLDQGLAANPDSPQLLFVKAGVLEQEGDFDGAIEVYEKLYAQNPNSMVLANNLASLLTTHRGDAASFERAAAVAGRLRGIPQPAFQDTWGWIALNRGDVDEAIAHLEPAAQGIPNDAVVQYHLARAYEAADRLKEARAQYAKVLELAEANNDTRAQIADARTRLEALPTE